MSMSPKFNVQRSAKDSKKNSRAARHERISEPRDPTPCSDPGPEEVYTQDAGRRTPDLCNICLRARTRGCVGAWMDEWTSRCAVRRRCPLSAVRRLPLRSNIERRTLNVERVDVDCARTALILLDVDSEVKAVGSVLRVVTMAARACDE